MTRRLRLLLLILALPVLLLASAWYWLLHTQSGAAFVWSQLGERVPGGLSANSVAGDFGSGHTATGVHFNNADLEIRIARLSFSLDVDLLPLSVTVQRPQLESIDVELRGDDSEGAAAGPDIAEVLESLQLPLEVAVEDLQLNALRLGRPNEDAREIVTNMTGSVFWSDELRLDNLFADTPLARGTIDGQLSFLEPFAHRIAIASTVKDIGLVELDGSEFALSSGGTLHDVEFESSLSEPGIRASGTITDSLSDAVVDIVVSGSALRWPLVGEPTVSATDFAVTVAGKLDDYRTQATSAIETNALGLSNVMISGSGSRSHFSADQLQVDGVAIELTGTGTIDWSDELAVDAAADIRQVDPRNWVGQWPQNFPLSGAVDVTWRADRIELREFVMRQSAAGIEASASGLYDSTDGQASGELQWQGLRWPIDAQTPSITSDSGAATLSGNPDEWQLDGRFSIAAADLPAGELAVRGEGNREQLALQIDESAVLGGRIAGDVRMRWSGDKAFAADLSMDTVHIDALLPDWPGRVSGKARFQGVAAPFSLQAEFAEIDGELRGEPLAAYGGVSIDDGNVFFNKLSLQHGRSKLTLNGSHLAPEGLNFDVDVNNLDRYADALGGDIRGSGKISLYDEPSVHVNATAERIHAPGIEIESIDLRDNGSGRQIDQRIEVRGLQIGKQYVEEAVATLRGNLSGHTVELDAAFNDIQLGFSSSGTIEQPTDWSALRWDALVQRVDVEIPDVQKLALREPVALSAAAVEVRFDDLCLAAEDLSEACLRLQWRRAGDSAIAATLTAIPLADIAAMVDTDFRFSQKISGSLEWTDAGQHAAGGAAFTISDGEIFSEADDNLSVETGQGRFGFDVVDRQVTAGYFDLPVPGSGEIDIDFGVGELDRGTDAGLTGMVLVNLQDVGVFARLVSGITQAQGRIATDIDVGGTLGSPLLNGAVSVHDAAMLFTPLGLQLSRVNVDAEVVDSRKLVVDGRFLAGDGQGRIRTTANDIALAGSGFEIEITGENLHLIDRPQLSLIAEPDVRLAVRENALNIDGRVVLPRVRLAPTEVPAARESESGDVVIVAGNDGRNDDANRQDQGIVVNGDLRVELGDDVVVDLGVARTTLSGSADFSWADQVIPVANGRFNINGTIAAFGQVLTITEGTVRFPQRPVDNPLLNIRAEREIFGNAQVKSAGVLVSGTAQDPTLQAYTEPRTTEERALSLLATGSDFDYEQGVGAIDFGTYIAPRLFLSYGIGIFDRENVISLRYDLTRGLGVKATSGEKQSGFDISYRIEN